MILHLAIVTILLLSTIIIIGFFFTLARLKENATKPRPFYKSRAFYLMLLCNTVLLITLVSYVDRIPDMYVQNVNLEAARVTGMHLDNDTYYITVNYDTRRMYRVDNIEQFELGGFVDIIYIDDKNSTITILKQD